MNCKLCGKDLYEQITFYNLFKWHYNVHHECEQQLMIKNEPIAFPIVNKIMFYSALFAIGYPKSDKDYLFTWYMGNLLYKHYQDNNRSMCILLDYIHNQEDLQLIFSLVEDKGLLISMFEEEIVEKE